jgi:hypothetical protein
LGNLRLAAAGGGLSDVRHAGWMMVNSVWECLALANQSFADNGRILEHVRRLPSKPADMEQLVTTISTSTDAAQIAAAAERLAADTRRVLREFQDSLRSPQPAVARFREAYPEISAMLGKVRAACGRQDAVAAGAAAWFAQYDVSAMLADVRGEAHSDFNLYHEFAALYRQIGLPELMRSPARGFAELEEGVGLFDERMREWLGTQSVGLQEYATIEELEHSLDGRASRRKQEAGGGK